MHTLSYILNNMPSLLNLHHLVFAGEFLIQSPIKIFAIACDSVFNSILTFNVAFTKGTGFTNINNE